MSSLIVAGVMSGTSADGVDVAICRISDARATAEAAPTVKLLGHAGFAYPKAVRAKVLAAMDGASISVADISRLGWRLGEVYADAVEKTAAKFGTRLDFVSCHGQTIYHQAVAAPFAGRPVRATWQIGEASVIAERLRIPVVSDFRPADVAAGGQGAPLVSMLDYVMFRHAKKNRVLLNLGGIANLTAIPAGAGVDSLLAFDTGPGNMVIDRCMELLFGRAFDRNGTVARGGRVLRHLVDDLLKDGFFAAPPPKSCGREQFGAPFAEHFVSICRKANAADADAVATATTLTTRSIVEAYRRFVWAHLGQTAPLAKTELIVSGGGVKNGAMMTQLRASFEPLGVTMRAVDDLGLSAQSKEAVAFALLGWLTWHRKAGNVMAATGAARPAVLGKVTFA